MMEKRKKIEKKNFIEDTKILWSQYYERRLSNQEALEIKHSFYRLFEVLRSINQNGKGASRNG